ncbi:MAG: DUF5615 family PIN-like protein [Bryobacteraceae bacterium]
MARFYSNEYIPLQVVTELRGLGHGVLTSLDAGRANASVTDSEVLAFAAAESRILLSHNRRIFCICIDTERWITRASSFAVTWTSAGRRNESTRRFEGLPYDINDRVSLNNHPGSLTQNRESYHISCWQLSRNDLTYA